MMALILPPMVTAGKGDGTSWQVSGALLSRCNRSEDSKKKKAKKNKGSLCSPFIYWWLEQCFLFLNHKTLKDPRCKTLWYIYIMECHSALQKECIWVSPNEVDEPWAYCTERSKSERQILYINIYMESGKMVLMNLFARQQWKRRYREQACGYSVGRKGWGERREWYGNLYIKIHGIDSQ